MRFPWRRSIFLRRSVLAITFGVMGVINMAHGEFIMMGAYTGYVVQQVIPDHTLSIIVANPHGLCRDICGMGVAMERLVIRWLYARPLETLLATFGISIALAAAGQEHLWHAGPPADRSGVAGWGMGAERRGVDQLHPHRDLCAGDDFSWDCFPVTS